MQLFFSSDGTLHHIHEREEVKYIVHMIPYQFETLVLKHQQQGSEGNVTFFQRVTKQVYLH